MSRRIRNLVLFVGVVFGTVLLVTGLTSLSRGESEWWQYVVVAVLVFGLAWGPGRRLRDSMLPPGA